MDPNLNPNKDSNSMRKLLLLFPLAAVLIAGIIQLDAQITLPDNTPIVPTIARVNRHQRDKVFLEHADQLSARSGVEYQILSGNVQFRKGDMFMYCDSAHLYEATNSIEAFGNVRMEQGDTLFVYADELVYTDSTELAVLYANNGKKVRLINRNVELKTNPFYYDLGIDLGYYNSYGELTDDQNRLTSGYGEYAPNTAEALFRDNVHLVSLNREDTMQIFTDQLYYNTDTHIAEMDVPSVIVTKDGKIFTDSAIYNTETSVGDLYRRSVVVGKQNTRLTADSLNYDRAIGVGFAWGNVVMTDSSHNMMLIGDYGYFNENADSAFVTGRALAKEFSKGDTLYLHSDTIRTYRIILPETIDEDSLPVPPDTLRYLVAAHKVKFFRSDLQGVCDSMTFEQSDSMLYLNRHPIVWSDNRQIFGNFIKIHLNDSTVETAALPDFGFMAEEIEEGFYQQLTGKQMLATFVDGELSQLDVSGNVEALSFPMEEDSTYNKFVTLQSSFLEAQFAGRELKRLKTWSESTSVITPLYLSKRSQLFLEQFKWYAPFRPSSPEDVFNISEDLREYLDQPDESNVLSGRLNEMNAPRRGPRRNKSDRPTSAVQNVTEQTELPVTEAEAEAEEEEPEQQNLQTE